MGPSGFVDHRFTWGAVVGTLNPSLQFIGPTAAATIATGQRVFVSSSAALGSSHTNGGDSLTLWICYQGQGSLAPAVVGSGQGGLKATTGQRLSFNLSAVLTGLVAGTYQFGLCGTASNLWAPWNNNGNGYTTALIF